MANAVLPVKSLPLTSAHTSLPDVARTVARGEAHAIFSALRCPRTVKALLLWMWWRAGPGADFAVWRSIGTISRELGVSESAVHRAMAWCVARRLVQTVAQRRGVPMRMLRVPDGRWCVDAYNPTALQRIERHAHPLRVCLRHGVPLGRARLWVTRGGVSPAAPKMKGSNPERENSDPRDVEGSGAGAPAGALHTVSGPESEPEADETVGMTDADLLALESEADDAAHAEAAMLARLVDEHPTLGADGVVRVVRACMSHRDGTAWAAHRAAGTCEPYLRRACARQVDLDGPGRTLAPPAPATPSTSPYGAREERSGGYAREGVTPAATPAEKAAAEAKRSVLNAMAQTRGDIPRSAELESLVSGGADAAVLGAAAFAEMRRRADAAKTYTKPPRKDPAHVVDIDAARGRVKRSKSEKARIAHDPLVSG